MKTKLSLTLLLSFIFGLLSSQIPQGFNYQAIARDGTGNPVANTSLPVRITIQADSAGTTILWQELHASVSSNSFGLINLVIGRGARQTASTVATFSEIDWSVTPKFIKTEIYYGSDYLTMGVSRLWSVPYALRAKDTDQWTTSGANIYRPTGNVGIGTTNTDFKLEVKGGESLFGYNSGNSALRFTTAYGNSFMFKPVDHGLQIQTDHTGNPVIMYIDKSGPVGIGNANPAYILDISGRARIRTGSGSAGVWFNNVANTSERAFIGMYDDDHAGFYGAGSSWGMVMDLNNGNVGIGSVAPSNKLEVNGQTVINGNLIAANSIRGGGYASGASLSGFNLEVGGPSPTNTNGIATIYLHHHGAVAHQLRYASGALFLEAAGNGYGTNTIPTFLIGGPLYAAVNGGNVGFGTTTSASKVAIQPESSWSDEVPLFEVKNKLGVPVLAVYNNGVRILVDHTIGKGIKSGFAVGGYDMTKAGKTVDLMIISPDSIRFNINNDNTKAVKSGFAVGGYDATKGAINQDFMYLTPQNSGNGKYNTFIGYKSGANTGGSTLYSNFNTFIGYQAGYSNTYGYSNVFLGYNAGYSNVGNSTGNYGYNNVYIGQLAGEKNNGTNNVFIGDEAGKALTGGSKNVIIGSAAGLQTTGNNNTYIGAGAGRFETGNDNVMIGYNAGLGSGESDLLVIGNRNNNALISGYFSTEQIFLWGKVGINTGAPASYLEIVAPGNALRLTRSASSNYFDLGIGTQGYLIVNNQVNSGAYCTGASWVNGSDMNLKENFLNVDGAEILAKVNELPVTSWNYIGDPDEVKHIGPVAQDFYKLFGLGNDDKSISTIDPAGLSIIAIKELSRRNQDQQKQIESMQQQIDELKAMVEKLVSDK